MRRWYRRCKDRLGQKIRTARGASLPGSPAAGDHLYSLQASLGDITVKQIFEIMRHHGDGYHPPARSAPQHLRACRAAGEPLVAGGWGHGNRCWSHGVMAGLPHLRHLCLDLKPVFLGMNLPDLGPFPEKPSTHMRCGGNTSCSTAGRWPILKPWCQLSVKILIPRR